MIASLLSVQSSSHENEAVKKILSQNENRIQSIALLHRMLYNAEVSSTVSLSQYLADLIDELKHALGVAGATFKLNTEVEQLSIESTISLGLILNELITNSVKYASSPEGLRISISLLKQDNQGHLEYQDNGKSFKTESFHKRGTFGARLITIQSKQLKGKFNVSDSNGFNFMLTFPIS
jgi:two-component system, sensor histidine kinase PdtaS